MRASPAGKPASVADERRLRIAVLTRVFSPTGGGAERYAIALVEELASTHDIHVFAQRIDHCWPGVSYHCVSAPLSRPRWINQLWYASLSWWATRRGFDVVHSHENCWHGQVQTVHVLPVKHKLFHGLVGARLALRCLKVASSPRLLTYLALERLRLAPRRKRCVVVTSPSLREVMAQTYPGCPVSVITPGVTLPAAVAEPEAARRALGLPLTGRLLAFVANDYEKKGLPTLLAALRHLPADVVLAVVGNPAHIERFRQQARDQDLGARVYFLGHLKEVFRLYEAADMLVHPTQEDTFAMVVLEAMAHGLPVVVSDAHHCGIAGLLTQGVNAMLLSCPTDARELAATLGRVLADPSLRERLASGAREFAASSAWPGIAREQARMYRAIAGLAS